MRPTSGVGGVGAPWGLVRGTCFAHPGARATGRRGWRRVVTGAWLAMLAVSYAPATAAAPPDACSLLSNADIHSLAPSLGKGRPGSVKIANVSTCGWPDAHGIAALTLQVAPAPSHSLHDDLASAFGAMGYDIQSVSGLGDEAVVAVQQADPKYGLQAGVAILSVRVGKRVVSLSPARIDVKPGSARYQRLKELAAKAAGEL
ncbi:MAG: hypothetical protein WCC36_11130 [Gammaproteobacteria bacterium]